MRNPNRILLVLSVLLFVGGSACTRSGPASAIAIRIAEGTQPVAAPVYVAFAKGYFGQEGIDASLSPFATGKLCVDALLGGKADFATSAETPVVHASFTDQPLRIVATFQRAKENTYIVARADKGIRSPVDLKGKTVVAPVGTNAEYALSRFLSANGLRRSDIRVINMSPPEMIGPLLKGDADAIVSWEPHAGRALRGLAGNGVRFSLAGVYEETYDLVTSVTMSRDNSATVAKVLRALDRAVTYMNANRVESVDIVARRIGMEKSELDPLWGVYTFGLDLRPALTELLRAEGEWAVEQGYQKPPVPEMSRLIAPDALRMAKPAAVQLP